MRPFSSPSPTTSRSTPTPRVYEIVRRSGTRDGCGWASTDVDCPLQIDWCDVTWYANKIFAEASPRLLDLLKHEPVLDGHLFVLTGSIPDSWEPSTGVVAMPAPGLLVAREVCPPRDGCPDDDTAEWHGKDAVSWDELGGNKPSAPSVDDPYSPPNAFLGFLKNLSDTAGVAVSYYTCCMFGGAPEIELAWVFEHGKPFHYCCERNERVDVRVSEKDRIVCSDDVLISTLRHHGVRLASPYFEPHTRSFGWDRYRL